MKMENVWTLLCLLHCICAADATREESTLSADRLLYFPSLARSAVQPSSISLSRQVFKKKITKRREMVVVGGKSGGSLFYSWKNKPPVAVAVLLIISLPSVSTGYHGGR